MGRPRPEVSVRPITAALAATLFLAPVAGHAVELPPDLGPARLVHRRNTLLGDGVGDGHHPPGRSPLHLDDVAPGVLGDGHHAVAQHRAHVVE